ncbi:FtsQ-type POTRA domain-containing protein [Akkermansia glycaniphila]|uniref:cell division protein FtsQ/DivIB n=1 Tax=Akkermansia glycaniphila TaxID=1679444 RepID=UPI001C02831F|nr:FtsQ-type POTRA domain-containing protein [Akkermansia glycaniphila]MBT9448497.1 FtsQ-type POTRA domain-containing protein [Akkermansia glycaniphila]
MARNSYRDGRSGKGKGMHSLEKALPLHVRFLNRVAMLRGMRHLRKWGIVALAAGLAVWLGLWIKEQVDAQSENFQIRTVDYTSAGIVSKEQALELMGLKGNENLVTLNTGKLEKKLIEYPFISSARVTAELPATLHVELSERVPVVRLFCEDMADADKYFMDPDGVVFTCDHRLHARFLGIPIWLNPCADGSRIHAGVRLDKDEFTPIVRLLRLMYARDNVPVIRVISRPKEWKLVVELETGTEAVFVNDDTLDDQISRLIMALRHAKESKRHIRHILLAPKMGIPVEYGDGPAHGMEDDGELPEGEEED